MIMVRQKYKAETLISMLVAVGITVFLVVVIIEVTGITNSQMKATNNLGDLNTRARYVHDTIYELASLAGYRGYAQSVSSNNNTGIFVNKDYMLHPNNLFPQSWTYDAVTKRISPGCFVAPLNDNGQGVIIAIQGSPDEDLAYTNRPGQRSAINRILDASNAPMTNKVGQVSFIGIGRTSNNALHAFNMAAGNSNNSKHLIDDGVVQFLVMYGVSSEGRRANEEHLFSEITSWKTDVSELENPRIAKSVRALRFIVVLESKENVFETPQTQLFPVLTFLNANSAGASSRTLEFGGPSRKKLALVEVFVPLRYQYSELFFEQHLPEPAPAS